MNRFLAALRFLTILPVPGVRGTSEDDLAASVPFFPLVGLMAGAVAAAVAWGVAPIAPPMVSAVVVMIVLMGISGCLHLDGLSDTADGFLSSRSRDKILAIMKDSHTGAMGVIAIVVVLMAKFAALASLPPQLLWPAALLMPLAGRAAIVVQMALLPNARPEGLAAIFYRKPPGWAAIWAAGVLAAVAVVLLEYRGLAVWAFSMAAALAVSAFALRKIGGATGDTFGAVCEIVEAVPPLTIALWAAGMGR